MFNFKEGVAVTYAQAHDVTFVPGGGQLSTTLDTNGTGTKISKMTLFEQFLMVELKAGMNLAIPVSNFKNIVLPKQDAKNS